MKYLKNLIFKVANQFLGGIQMKKIMFFGFLMIVLILSGWSFEVKDFDASRVELKDVKLLNYGYYPRWSPDGKKILYTSGNSIYMMNPDGNNKEYIIDGFDAAWSPDGKRIAYKKKKPARIAIFDLKTKKEYIIYDLGYDRSRRNYLSSHHLDCRTEWTRNGKKLFFIRSTSNYNPWLWTMWIINLDDLSEKKLTVRVDGYHKFTAEVNRNIAHPLFSIYVNDVNLHSEKYFPLGFSSGWLPSKSKHGPRRILDGIWVENKESGNSFAIRLLDSGQLRKASYTSPELSPDLTKLVFVKAELGQGVITGSLYIAKISRSLTSNIKIYEVTMGLNAGIKEKDILVVYEAKINPLNNKLVGYNERKMKGTVLVESVAEGKCRVRSYLVMENLGQNIVAVSPENKSFAYLKELSLNEMKETFERTKSEATESRKVVESTFSSKKIKSGTTELVKVAGAKLLRKVEPVYPEFAKKYKTEGVVILGVTINEHGRVVKVKVLRSSPIFDRCAINAVEQWVYEPVVIDGKQTAATFAVTVPFKLK